MFYWTPRGEEVNATIKRPNAINKRSSLAREGRSWRASWRRRHVGGAHTTGVVGLGHSERKEFQMEICMEGNMNPLGRHLARSRGFVWGR